MEKKIVFATKNKGKIREIEEIMASTGIVVASMEAVGIDIDVVEDGETFEANAIKKAVEIQKVIDGVVLADDSGLEVDFMNKAPGVHSARWAGYDTPYTIKNQKIIQALDGVQKNQRTARYVCVIAAAFPDGSVEIRRATFEGYIGYEERGSNGFGYDPIFCVPEYGLTVAEMDSNLKHKLSHRGKALRAIKGPLEDYFKG